MLFLHANRYPLRSKTLWSAHGGLRSCDHRRRVERRQRCARRRRTRPAGDPAGTGRPRRGRILGLAAADPWRSRPAGAQGLPARARRACRARHLAADRAAPGAPGARCVRADRLDVWRLAVIDRGHRQVITARALANATGAWTASVAETVLRMLPPHVGTAQISQIIVRRLFDTDSVYVFQNSDRRLIFASPYERDFTLIGTVGRAFKGDPAIVSVPAGDIAYLCDAANRYFRERIEASDVIRTVSGANAVMDPQSRRPERDGSIIFDAGRGKAPLLTIFGGDVTTSRLRAERTVSRLTPFYPMSPRWTAKTPLPGGDFAWTRFDDQVDSARERWRFLSEVQAQRLIAAYGSRLEAILGDAKDRAELGPAFGPELTAAEVRYLMTKEWARFPEDILWRRSKLGLTMPPPDREALAVFMATAGA